MSGINHVAIALVFSVALAAWGQQLPPGGDSSSTDAAPAPIVHPVTQTIQGTVKFGNQLVPGATVKVYDDAEHQAFAWTDSEGSYSISFTGNGDGNWYVTAKMSGFVVDHRITFAPAHPPGLVELQLTLAAPAPSSPSLPASLQARARAAAVKANHEDISVFDAEESQAPKAMPSPEAGSEMAASTIAIAGSMGKAAEAFSPPAGVNRIHGSLAYTLQGISFLDSLPYAGLTGAAPAPPGHSSSRFNSFLGGPLSLPHIYDDKEKRTTFSVGASGQISSNLTDAPLYVPTEQERLGNFSGDNPIYDPLTGEPFPGNVIPQGRINPVAQALLKYIPLPNQSGAMNYLFVGTKGSNSDSVSFNLTHAFGPPMKTRPGAKAKWRDNFSLNVNYLGARDDRFGSLPTVGGSNHWTSIMIGAKYSISNSHWGNVLSLSVNKSHGEQKNQFDGVQNVSGDAGIAGISGTPADWGLPTLTFTNNYEDLLDIFPLSRRNMLSGLSDDAWRKWRRHSLKFGGNFQRRTIHVAYDAYPNGKFTFDGFATAQYDASGNQIAGTGNSFADFLLGDPQVASLQYGLDPYDFVNHSWSPYLNDNWNALKNLTLDLGLRYEYVSPYTEAEGHLVNLDANSDFTVVAPVFPGTVGLYHGIYPDSLIKPDYRKFAPAVGLAWKASTKTVVRTGYRIHYDPDQYARMVIRLAYEPPFMVSTKAYAAEPGSPAFGDITLQNAFSPVATDTITNTFAVDPNYRIGYVQTWLLAVQQELFRGTVLHVGYNGAKGTHLDTIRVPNRNPDGTWLIPNVQPFLWESSQASSIFHQGYVRLSQRMTKGLSADVNYAFGKSIDNASSIGGMPVMVAQNDRDLAAERGLSSFDIRQSLTGSYTYELPWGTNKRWLDQRGQLSQCFGDMSWSGSFTIQSGTPFTANVTSNYTTINQGANGSLRANYNGQPIQLAHPGIGEWFNTAAFSAPADGAYGDAGRNTIIGPGLVNFNMTLSKTLRISEQKHLDFRVTANNVFNTPHFADIDTTLGDKLFGQVTNVGSMRTIVLYTGFKF